MKKELSLAAALLSVLGCSSHKSLENVPIVWKPTSGMAVSDYGQSDLVKQRLSIHPFTDSRTNKREIGRNLEESPTRMVSTNENVGMWCTNRLTELLKSSGANFSESNPTLIISGEVVDFRVDETDNYNGRVGIKIKASEPNGRIIWEGMMSGTAKRFGRSFNIDNYYETLSDAFLEGFSHLMRSDLFVHTAYSDESRGKMTEQKSKARKPSKNNH